MFGAVKKSQERWRESGEVRWPAMAVGHPAAVYGTESLRPREREGERTRACESDLTRVLLRRGVERESDSLMMTIVCLGGTMIQKGSRDQDQGFQQFGKPVCDRSISCKSSTALPMPGPGGFSAPCLWKRHRAGASPGRRTPTLCPSGATCPSTRRGTGRATSGCADNAVPRRGGCGQGCWN